jgi:transcriptional regulator
MNKEIQDELDEMTYGKAWGYIEITLKSRIEKSLQTLLTCKDFNDMIKIQQKVVAMQELLGLPEQLLREAKYAKTKTEE